MTDKLSFAEALKEAFGNLLLEHIDRDKVKSLRINSEENKCSIYAYLSGRGEMTVGFCHSDGSLTLEKTLDIHGISAKKIEESGRRGIGLAKSVEVEDHVFFEFLGYLSSRIVAIEKIQEIQTTIYRELRSWKLFFKNGSRYLKKNQILGLSGEIKTLVSCLKYSDIPSASAIKTWEGPSGGLHDFVFPHFELEVKSSVEPAKHFEVSGEDQLADIDGKKLFLLLCCFLWDQRGQSLDEVVQEARQHLKADKPARDEFEDRVHMAGYTDLHADYYGRPEMRLSFVRQEIFCVEEGFPRVLPASISGVSVRQYSVVTEQCYPFAVSDKNEIWDKLIWT